MSDTGVMEEKAWWKEAVVYQLYPRSFSDSNGDGIGDLRGIMGKLDYLQWLGVNVVWLNPVYRSPNDDGGYDISDYRAIHPDFGTMEDFDLLLKEMHRRGIRLVMDLVVNHTSDEHPWFVESSKSADSPWADYYIWRKPGAAGEAPNDWLSFFEGPAWEYHPGRGEYYLHLFSRKQPDLNWENPRVREEVHGVMQFWLEKGIDGFRMDVINLISKAPGLPDSLPGSRSRIRGGEHFINGPGVVEYLREMGEKVLQGKDIMTVGETPDVDPETGLRYVGKPGGPLDLLFQFEHMDIDYGADGYWDIGAWSPSDLFAILSKWQRAMEGRGWNSLYLNNHDQPRQVSRLGNDGKYWRESAKLLAIFNHTLKGTPFIYQGEELGMKNVPLSDPGQIRDIGAANFYRRATAEGMDQGEVLRRLQYRSRDNARTPMQWDGTKHGGFTAGTPWIGMHPEYRDINVAVQQDDPGSILSCYRKLVALRSSHPLFVYGTFREVHGSSGGPIVYTRDGEPGSLLVILNWSNQEQPLEGRLTWLDALTAQYGNAELLISSYGDTVDRFARLNLLRPWEGAVYYLEA